MFSNLGSRVLARSHCAFRLTSLPVSNIHAARSLSHKGGTKVPTQVKAEARTTAALLQAAATLRPSGAAGSSPATSPAASTVARSAPPADAAASSAPEGKWRDFAGIAALLTAVAGILGWLLASRASASFRERRVKAVKERLKSTLKRAQQPAVESTKGAGTETLPLFDRPYASSVVAQIVETAGLYMVCGPKGEGKSSLMEQLEKQHAFVIRVDLQNGSIDKAVRALAAAMGYSLTYTADEVAAKAAGVSMPAINTQQGIADFEELLLVFEQACNELREEGALGDHVPVLILE